MDEEAALGSNGAGKTTLAMAPFWALTGSTDARADGRPIDARGVIHDGAKRASVTLRGELVMGDGSGGENGGVAEPFEVTRTMGKREHSLRFEVGGMAATLGQWHATAGALLGSLREKLEFYKAQVDAAKENQAQLDAKVEAVKATVRAQHEAGELHDDTMMDFDDGEDNRHVFRSAAGHDSTDCDCLNCEFREVRRNYANDLV